MLNTGEKDVLSIGEIDKISRSIGSFTYLLLGGGEPFLREDLPDIVDCFYRHCNVRNVAISTNGSMPENIAAIVRKILATYKNNLTINVSFDAIGQEHDEIRQLPGIFSKACSTYQALRQMTSEYPNLNAGIIMTCSPYNHHSLRKTYTQLKELLHPDSIVLNYMRGNVKDRDKLPQTDLDAYADVMKMIERDNVSGDIPGHRKFPFADINLASKKLMRRIVYDTVRENSFQLPCFAGILNCVLWHNGDIFPCEMLDRKLGNLRHSDYDFKKVWYSPEAGKIRSYIKKSACFCTEECNINMNILFNPAVFPGLIKNVIRIKLLRYLGKLRRRRKKTGGI
jgi:MoaA/NifB/PqqE/SkfB family radical SAM enzyme